MRRLRLVFARREGVSVLVAATLLPWVSNCGGKGDADSGVSPRSGTSNSAAGSLAAGSLAATNGGSTSATIGSNLGGSMGTTTTVVSTGGSAIGGSAIGGSAIGGSAIGGSAIGGSAIGGSAIGGSAIGGSAIGGSAIGGSAIGGSAIGGSAIGGSAIGGSAIGGATTGICPNYAEERSYVVALPSKGSEAEMAQTCGWTQDFTGNTPVATIALTNVPNDPTRATGTLTLSAAVLENAGYLVVRSLIVAGGAVSNLRQVGSQYQFDVTWQPEGLPYLGATRTFQINIATACAPERSSTRELQIAANVVQCGSYEQPTWVSGGDLCSICQPMAEFVAAPMPAPADCPGGLPLQDELKLEILPVARDGRYLVLRATGPETLDSLSLTWHASAGELLTVAGDVAIWTLPDHHGPHLVQVAAESETAAGVGIYLHRDDATHHA